MDARLSIPLGEKHTTFFEAPDRDIAERYIDVFFIMLMGNFFQPKGLVSTWVSLKGNNKAFQGYILDEEDETTLIFSGFLYNTDELKKETESQPNATDKKLLDKLKSETDFPTI